MLLSDGDGRVFRYVVQSLGIKSSKLHESIHHDYLVPLGGANFCAMCYLFCMC